MSYSFITGKLENKYKNTRPDRVLPFRGVFAISDHVVMALLSQLLELNKLIISQELSRAVALARLFSQLSHVSQAFSCNVLDPTPLRSNLDDGFNSQNFRYFRTRSERPRQTKHF
jgi:hypothetical protein